jgi:hypothetical protein
MLLVMMEFNLKNPLTVTINQRIFLENLICRMILQFDVLFVTIDKLVEEAQLPGQPHEK